MWRVGQKVNLSIILPSETRQLTAVSAGREKFSGNQVLECCQARAQSGCKVQSRHSEKLPRAPGSPAVLSCDLNNFTSGYYVFRPLEFSHLRPGRQAAGREGEHSDPPRPPLPEQARVPQANPKPKREGKSDFAGM